MSIPTGTIDCCNVRLIDPMALQNIDIAIKTVKQTKRYVKKAAGSRRRLVIKYETRLNNTVVANFEGMSHSMAEMHSADG